MNAINEKIISFFLLIAIVAGSIFIVPKVTSAQIPGTGMPVWCVPWDLNCFKEMILKPAAKAIMKKFIHQLRAATINWIITGDFEIKKPFFVTSFIGDPQRIADNAARLFLSELTGINFCNFHPSLQSIQALMIPNPFNISLSCDPSLGRNGRFGNGSGGLLASTHPSANFSTIMNDLKSELENSIRRGISAYAEEARNNSGFLGQRDPKTGKIKTPGNLIAETIIGSQNSEMFGQEVNNDIFNAIADIIDTAIGQTIKKGLLK